MKMKYALVDGERQEAQPKLSGKCPVCEQPVIAKCGELRVEHWAHKGRRSCDPWWENETEWHRAWKSQFPKGWQEVVHKAEDGERHIADVKTERGWVLEFQHSYLKPEERRSRDAFYRKLIWVADATSRERDRAQLLAAWEKGVGLGNLGVRKISGESCGLVRKWSGTSGPVLFDFGEAVPQLWWLFARSIEGPTYIAPYLRASFIEGHCGRAPEVGRQFDMVANEIPKILAEYEAHLRARAALQHVPIQPPQGFARYMFRRERSRRRL
jgi:hypothetical protein